MRSSVRSRLAPPSPDLKGLDDVSSRLNVSYPFRCNLSVSLSARALNVTKAKWPASRIPVLRRSVRPSISDIVKRKRIRSRAGWGEAPQASREGYGLRQGVLSFIRPFEQPVVGLEPDRSDPRMRLKQNWSFQRRRRRNRKIRNRKSECSHSKLPGSDFRLPKPRFGDESNQVP